MDAELVLGFDLRADPATVWAARGTRPQDYLLRAASQPLAVDDSVWPSLPTGIGGAEHRAGSGWRYFSAGQAGEARGPGQWDTTSRIATARVGSPTAAMARSAPIGFPVGRTR